MSVLHQEIRIFVPCNENEIIGKKNHEGQRWGRKKNEVLCFPGIARMLEVLWPMWWSQNRPQTSTVGSIMEGTLQKGLIDCENTGCTGLTVLLLKLCTIHAYVLGNV